MASEAENRAAFRKQEQWCGANDAPIYARLCAALAAGLTRDTALGVRVLDWPGEPTRDALPLRLLGGLHALVRAGADPELAELFAGRVTEPDAVRAGLLGAIARHEAALLPWLDGPPQTNEPGRSAALILGLLDIARRHGPRIELLEIGSSAGLNLLIDRYRLDLGGVSFGPADSPVLVKPARWTGPPPEPARVEFVSVAGCDVAPLDARDPAVAARLAAYVWPETPERLERTERAVAMLRAKGVALRQADAADWLEARLARPQTEGVARVLMHSVVWQYLPGATADRVRAAMEESGARATAARPLGWVTMEPDVALGDMTVRARSWPGEGWRTLATSHPHATWVNTAV